MEVVSMADMNIRIRITKKLLAAIERKAKLLELSSETVAARAIKLGLQAASDELAMELMDQSLAPLRRTARKNRGKSMREFLDEAD